MAVGVSGSGTVSEMDSVADRSSVPVKENEAVGDFSDFVASLVAEAVSSIVAETDRFGVGVGGTGCDFVKVSDGLPTLVGDARCEIENSVVFVELANVLSVTVLSAAEKDKLFEATRDAD